MDEDAGANGDKSHKDIPGDGKEVGGEGPGAFVMEPIAMRRTKWKPDSHSLDVIALLNKHYPIGDGASSEDDDDDDPVEAPMVRSKSSPHLQRVLGNNNLGRDAGPSSPSVDADQPKSGSITPVTTPRH